MLSPLPLLLGLSPSALPLLLGLSPCAALLAGAERVPPPSLATAVLQPLVLCLRRSRCRLSISSSEGHRWRWRAPAPRISRGCIPLVPTPESADPPNPRPPMRSPSSRMMSPSCSTGLIMVLSRLSQLGARFLKESGIGQFCVTRRRCVKGPSSHYLYPMRSLPFSTAAGGETHEENSEQKEKITVTFVDKDGEEKVIQVPIGMSMLEAAHENDIELEGACEGSLACSTCHVIVMDMEYYNKLEDPADEENDMLDLAFGLTETSRLGCQVIAKPELDGIRLALPAATRNFAVDGFVPKPH